MVDKIEIKSSAFLFWWVAGSLFVYPTMIVIGSILLFFVGMVVGFSGYIGNYGDIIDGLSIFLTVPIFGAFLGGTIGYIQRGLMRKYLYWTADYWIALSALGGAVGLFIALLVAFFFDSSSIFDSQVLTIGMPSFMLILSAFQWVSLRRATGASGLWVLANVVGGLVFVGLFINAYVGDYTFREGYYLLTSWAVAAVAQGFVLAIVLLHLFENHAYPVVLPDELRGTTFDTTRKPSIWDEAI